jgi:hypothetical protein
MATATVVDVKKVEVKRTIYLELNSEEASALLTVANSVGGATASASPRGLIDKIRVALIGAQVEALPADGHDGTIRFTRYDQLR